MAIDESTLTKGQMRKLNALRRSVGDALGEEVFAKWLAQQVAASAPNPDAVAVKIEEALTGLGNDKTFNYVHQAGTSIPCIPTDQIVTDGEVEHRVPNCNQPNQLPIAIVPYEVSQPTAKPVRNGYRPRKRRQPK